MSLRDLPIPRSMPTCQNLSTDKLLATVPGPLATWQDPGMSQTFGERLRAAMQAKELNQTKLATLTGIDPGAVSRHLRAEEPPSTESVRKYSEALGRSYEWLVSGREGRRAERDAVLLGSTALEQVLAYFDWPDVEISVIDGVAADARAEASAAGRDRTESMWHLRVRQLLRVHSGRTKAALRRPAVEGVDLTQESPEVRRGRKSSKRA